MLTLKAKCLMLNAACLEQNAEDRMPNAEGAARRLALRRIA